MSSWRPLPSPRARQELRDRTWAYVCLSASKRMAMAELDRRGRLSSETITREGVEYAKKKVWND